MTWKLATPFQKAFNYRNLIIYILNVFSVYSFENLRSKYDMFAIVKVSPVHVQFRSFAIELRQVPYVQNIPWPTTVHQLNYLQIIVCAVDVSCINEIHCGRSVCIKLKTTYKVYQSTYLRKKKKSGTSP